jgi:UPF0755 protein
MPPMKRVIFPAIILFAILVVAIGGYFWWIRASAPVSGDLKEVSVVIPRGRSAGEIGQILYDEGLVKNPLAFKFYIQLTGNSGNLQAGEFLLSPSYNLAEILEALTGPPAQIWVTIPEGLRREQVVERLVEGLELEPPESTSFRIAFLTASKGLEGYLFPDTYLFAKDAPASAVVSKMNNTFETQYASAEANTSLSENEVIVLASIIERETKTDEERPIVAGILIKRMENDWPLQADAAVQYAVANELCGEGGTGCGNWWPTLTIENLQMDSPYNTYKFGGLPPHPIANPGLSSIKAAMKPEDSAYWYYIHDSEGNIHFAKTLEEHNLNIGKYLGK